MLAHLGGETVLSARTHGSECGVALIVGRLLRGRDRLRCVLLHCRLHGGECLCLFDIGCPRRRRECRLLGRICRLDGGRDGCLLPLLGGQLGGGQHGRLLRLRREPQSPERLRTVGLHGAAQLGQVLRESILGAT